MNHLAISLETIIREARRYNPEKYRETHGWERYFFLDYGTFPEYDDFDSMIEFISEGGSRRIKFENDSYVGTCELTSYELWSKVFEVWKEVKFLNHCGLNQKAQNNKLWVENLLKRLGWEWVK